ncbi:MAG: hypothetical protein JWO99_134 [Candidatus Saccharibacteria bacterium]|nr:hypothetical protein [Candidatus Saccharibacteria bacterium]
MSETAPTFTAPKSADQVEIERLEALVEKRKFERDQNEKFGKYDPQEEGPINQGEHSVHRGEYSHESYHVQRPSEGIIRDGDVLRQVGGSKNGDFASVADYEAQTGSTHDQPLEYYDKVNGIEDNAEYVAPDYENMTVPELALATAKANSIGDKAEADQIRAVFEHLLMIAATDPGNESKTSDEDYQKELERFDHLVELAVKQQESKNPDAAVGDALADKNERRAEAEAKGEPFDEDEGEDPAGKTESEKTDAEKADDETKGEKTNKPETGENGERKVGDKAIFEGEEVTITDVYKTSDGKVAYDLLKADGAHALMGADKVTFTDETAEKESVAEKAKAFWKKGKNFIAEKLTIGYMATKWAIEDSIINRGIDPLTTNFEDAEKIKHRRRIALVAGTAAVLVILAVTRDIHGFGGGGGAHVADALPTPTPTPSASEVPTSDGSEFMLPQTPHTPELNPNDPAFTLTPVDQAPAAPTPDVLSAAPSADALSNPNFTITRGEGGLKLFNRLGIDPGKWAANATRLLQQHGEDFYPMDGGGIGISHSGALSEATRIDLLNIKNS